MANINLLTPTSVYGRSITFQTAAGAGGSLVKSYIATAVPAGKTQCITGLSWQFTDPNLTTGGYGYIVKIYKRLANSTIDLFIVDSSVRVAEIYGRSIAKGDYEIFSKRSGFYLQEGEALIIEAVPSVRGYMTYLEIG
jgi:hypothetical protein